MNVNIGEDQHIQLADHPEFVRFQISDINQSIPQRFETQVSLHPSDSAVTADGESWTYEQLNEKANRLACALLSVAGDKTEPVVLLCPSSDKLEQISI